MPIPKPLSLNLTEAERAGLEKLINQYTVAQQIALRARIVLAAAEGKSNRQIAVELQVSRQMVRLWRARWLQLQAIPLTELSVVERLEDLPRPGAPARISAAQRCQIEALACEKPEEADRPISHWTGREIAAEIIKRGIVTQISARHAGRLLKEADLKPHLIRYWLTSQHDDEFEAKNTDVNDLYHQAAELVRQGERVVSNDELTGVQALERKHPGLPLRPGKVERREYEYIRHGTLTFIINFEVVTGQVGLVSAGPTRTEQDYLISNAPSKPSQGSQDGISSSIISIFISPKV